MTSSLPTRAVVGLLAVGPGCKSAIDPAALGYDVDAARAFQEHADAELMTEVSPLSAVAAYYVEPGHSLHLAVEGDALVEREAAGEGVSIVAESDATVVIVSDSGGRRTVKASVVERLGRFSLSIGPQSGTTRVVVHDPQAQQRRTWQQAHDGRRNWFSVDPAMIVGARLQATQSATEVTLPTTRGLTKALPQVGSLSLSLGGERVSLDAFEAGPGALLVPFTDPTNGATSYPVGRYVTVDRPKSGDAVVVDFNRATNPWCAYSEHYNCPIPPKDNAVPVEVRAGEGLPHTVEGSRH